MTEQKLTLQFFTNLKILETGLYEKLNFFQKFLILSVTVVLSSIDAESLRVNLSVPVLILAAEIRTTLQCLVIFRNVLFCFMAEDDKSQIFVFLQTMASRRFLPHVLDFYDTNFLHYTFFSAQEKKFLVKFDKKLNCFSA